MQNRTIFTVNLTNKVTLPSVDYINDIAVEKNFSLGTSFIDPPKILSDLYYLFQKENEDPIAFDVNKYLFSSEYIEDNILKSKMDNSQRAYYNYTLLFLQQIDYSNVLGITPLDKSLNVLMYLTHLTDSLNDPNQQGDYGENNPAGAGNIEIGSEEQLAQAIQEMSEGVDGLAGDDGTVPADPRWARGGNGGRHGQIRKEMTSCVRDHLYDLTPSIAHVYGKSKPADVPINKRILNDIKIKAYLEESVGLETALDSKKVRNNDSQEKETDRMQTTDEVTKVRKSHMMLENFDEKLVKKELNVQTKVKPKEKKQILYMLLDDSGSMGCLEKQTFVRAILLNRLVSVVDGKSELKFSLYESSRYEFSHVTNKKETQNLFKKISLRSPSGGGTHIGRILQETINEIHADTKTGYHDPEIMIVCDGDDFVDPSKLDYKDVRINVVLLGCDNKNLRKVAEQSGGFFTMEKLYERY